MYINVDRFWYGWGCDLTDAEYYEKVKEAYKFRDSNEPDCYEEFEKHYLCFDHEYVYTELTSEQVDVLAKMYDGYKIVGENRHHFFWDTERVEFEASRAMDIDSFTWNDELQAVGLSDFPYWVNDCFPIMDDYYYLPNDEQEKYESLIEEYGVDSGVYVWNELTESENILNHSIDVWMELTANYLKKYGFFDMIDILTIMRETYG